MAGVAQRNGPPLAWSATFKISIPAIFIHRQVSGADATTPSPAGDCLVSIPNRAKCGCPPPRPASVETKTIDFHPPCDAWSTTTGGTSFP